MKTSFVLLIDYGEYFVCEENIKFCTYGSDGYLNVFELLNVFSSNVGKCNASKMLFSINHMDMMELPLLY